MDKAYSAEKLRELTTQELSQKLNELKNEMFNLRFQLAIGHLKNTSRIKDVRKNIARVLTVNAEKLK